ncbi:MAG: DMT family transporter [Actinomycetota bacterium]
MRTKRVLSTAEGSRPEAFGPVEWSLLAAVGLMWGSSFLFIAIGLETFEPAVVSLARLGLGTAAISLVPAARRPVAREDIPRIVLLALVWMAIPLLLFPMAQDLGLASSVAGMINGGMPLFAALFAWMLLRRPPGSRQGIGLLVGFAGVVLVTLPEVRGASATALGAVLALVATALYGLAANITVPLQQRYGALPVVFRAQLVALVAVLPFGVAGLPGSRFAWPGTLAMVVLGVFGTGLAFIAMSNLVGRAGATRGAVAIYFIPVVALVLGVTFRDESVDPIALVGVVMILAGAWLTTRRERAR